jgi:hypothetical protein
MRRCLWIIFGCVGIVVAAPCVSPAAAITTQEDARGACDGIKTGAWGFHTASGEQDPWWQVDLGREFKLDRIVVFNRTDGNTAPRTRNLRVLVAGSDPTQFQQVYQHDGTVFFGVKESKPLVVGLKEKNVKARIVRLQVPGRCSFALDEVEVYAADDPTKNVALDCPADQKSVGVFSYPAAVKKAAGTAGLVAKRPGPPVTAVEGPRELLDRAKKLLARLRPMAEPAKLQPLADELQNLEQRLAAAEKEQVGKRVPQEDVTAEVRDLVRRIAFTNPLLTGIDKLLFIKRHDAGGPYHMCDQYYGCNAKPGGGLFVLGQPFGPAPKLVNLLENSVVENGRLKGQKLVGGSFLSPEVSYDGKTVLFAYSECKAKQTYQWAPEYSYHIFKVNADGTGLVQLTDGPWNDFDPCFLPGGRIAFVSERRGGYLRCGRHCPVYTLHSMELDGSDIINLSFHETHEWHPSVSNDGMLVYTRWDYVDRDTNIAHHLWTCYPDGRDPRSFHGNYPLRRESRPWMEMSIRAIPGSHRYVATAASHHGHAFGSLVLIDPRPEDDLAVSQIERLTPDIPFPESSGVIMPYQQYATAWPLSEDDYLCVYDPKAANHAIYWIDRDGNKALVYADPAIACQDPIPLRARAMPPVLPDQTVQTAKARESAGGEGRATVAVINVYDSDFPWPSKTRISALRVIQVLPKSTAPPNQPRIGVAEQTNARAVLGTVPVEADGSAYFEAPPGKALYFQALDERGMAVQSMRSATYLHPGERLVCAGCHERKHSAGQVSNLPGTGESANLPGLERSRSYNGQVGNLPHALRRGPSKIEPDVDGSNPFNYPRLVQPVLDRHCVGCHQEKKALELAGTLDRNGFTRSYNNLASKYGFYFHVTNGSIKAGVHGGSRTLAGRFGAAAAPLLQYLDEEHHGVKLSAEDFHRITLWLDCNSEFLGAYERADAQARGEAVRPSLE